MTGLVCKKKKRKRKRKEKKKILAEFACNQNTDQTIEETMNENDNMDNASIVGDVGSTYITPARKIDFI